eukprot:3941911-Rhodomonas_salina.4
MLSVQIVQRLWYIIFDFAVQGTSASSASEAASSDFNLRAASSNQINRISAQTVREGRLMPLISVIPNQLRKTTVSVQTGPSTRALAIDFGMEIGSSNSPRKKGRCHVFRGAGVWGVGDRSRAALSSSLMAFEALYCSLVAAPYAM